MGLFKSEAGRSIYLAAYETMLAEWGMASASHHVSTRLGTTHVIVAGKADAPPLVLLPAISVSATEWFANARDLGQHRRLFAIDIVGDAGLSVLERQPQSPADYADWLAEVFAGLRLDRPAVVGHSYGGWLTLALAVHRPDAVGPIVVLAPSSGLAPFRWYMKAFLALAERLPFKPGARSTLRMQAHKGFVLNETFVRLMEVMTANLRTNVLFPGMFTDAELAGIKSDALVLIGEEEVLYDPRFALDRALRLIPRAAGELVPNSSHLLIMERPEAVDRAVLAFLAERRNGTSPEQGIPRRAAGVGC